MHLPLGLLVLVMASIVSAWAWLGAAVPMPVSPIAANEKLYCVSYAPFRGSQNPLDASIRVSAAQIDDDLARLSRITDCIRTYSVQHGLDQIPEIAARHGLKMMLGLWLSGHADKNARELETVVALANRHRDVVRAVVVGNEVLLRGEMAAADLAATIRRVKTLVPAPVTYADVWEFWLRHRDVYAAVDFVTIHILPYWEDFPVPAREAAAHVGAIRARVLARFPDKEVLLGETGWPSAGRMREGALPSPANQARVIHEVLAAATRDNYRVNVIEAFDQPWKRWLEGTVGGHWGLSDAEQRRPKFVWGEPVSDHPLWRLQSVPGVVLAMAVVAGAWSGRRRERPPSPARWLAVASIALVAGILLGWTLEKAALESLGVGGWLRSLVLVAVAITAPLIAAAALMRDAALPGFAQILGGAADRAAGPVVFALGAVFVVLCASAVEVALGLVFDPRYRDFPFTALTAGAVPYLLLVLSRRNGRSPKPARAAGGSPWRQSNLGERAAEVVTAVVLGVSAIYIVLNESFANWQAVWFCAALLALVITLLRAVAAPSSE